MAIGNTDQIQRGKDRLRDRPWHFSVHRGRCRIPLKCASNKPHRNTSRSVYVACCGAIKLFDPGLKETRTSAVH